MTPDELRDCRKGDKFNKSAMTGPDELRGFGRMHSLSAKTDVFADAWEADRKDLLRLWEMGCCCGVITLADGEDWDRIQERCAALAGKEMP